MTFRELKIGQPFSFVPNGPVYVKASGKCFTFPDGSGNPFQLRDPQTKTVIPRERPQQAAGSS